MIADITGAEIQVPVEEEAGCLGAAIQAMYAYGHHTGKPRTFAELSDTMVRVDEKQSAHARPDKLSSYEEAWGRYNETLAEQFPQLLP